MRRFLNTWRYIRHQYELASQQNATVNMIVRQRNCEIELPFFMIDGPERIALGNGTRVGKNAWLSCYDRYQEQAFTPEIIIGNNVRIGNYACIVAIDRIVIEDDCLLSDYVYISDHFHSYDSSLEMPLASRPLEKGGSVTIGSRTFIGMRASILPGVSLGKNCVVAAHSVVTRSFPANSMLGGIPAKLIKTYSEETQTWTKAASPTEIK